MAWHFETLKWKYREGTSLRRRDHVFYVRWFNFGVKTRGCRLRRATHEFIEKTSCFKNDLAPKFQNLPAACSYKIEIDWFKLKLVPNERLLKVGQIWLIVMWNEFIYSLKWWFFFEQKLLCLQAQESLQIVASKIEEYPTSCSSQKLFPSKSQLAWRFWGNSF